MKKRKYDVIAFGSNTVDLFVMTDTSEIKKGRKNLIAYPVGAKILIDETHFETGGGGTNTAVSFSRLGLKTGYLGKTSTDHFSEEVCRVLKKEKVSFLGKKVPGTNGHSVILDSKEHNRTILTFKGENNNVKFSDVNLRKLDTSWFYFSSLGGQSFKTQKKLVKYAKKKGIKIAFNPSLYQVKEGKRKLRSILKHTEILILNKDEAEALVGKKDTCKKLAALGPRYVCITDAAKSVSLYHENDMHTLRPHKMRKCRERTGAGDAFASGLVAGIILGKSPEMCLQLGLANAESVIMYIGAKNKLLTMKEALKVIKRNPGKVTKKAC